MHTVCTEILLQVGHYNKLQDDLMRRSLSDLVSLIRNSYNLSLNTACLLLSHSQVTLKAK